MAQVPSTRHNQGSHLPARRLNPLERLQRDFDLLFNGMWGGPMMPSDTDFESLRVWDFDIKDTNDEIVVRAEVPGFEEDELDVQINNETLTIKAEKQKQGEQETEYRSFVRRVSLPNTIDPNRVQATYRNGVLELHIAKSEAMQPRRIKVQGGATPKPVLGQPAGQMGHPQAGDPSALHKPRK